MPQRVKGENASGASERLATQADQATAISVLSSIDGDITSTNTKGLFVTIQKKALGKLIAGVGYPVDNTEYAAIKSQTKNVQHIEIDETDSEYDINLTPSGNQYPFAEINQLNISGFNLSTDTALLSPRQR